MNIAKSKKEFEEACDRIPFSDTKYPTDTILLIEPKEKGSLEQRCLIRRASTLYVTRYD